jgi:hypothetical protein
MARRHSLQGAAPELYRFANGAKPLSPLPPRQPTALTATEAEVDKELGVGDYDNSLFAAIARGRSESITDSEVRRRASSVDGGTGASSKIDVPKLPLPPVEAQSVEGNLVVSLVPFGGAPLKFTPVSEDSRAPKDAEIGTTSEPAAPTSDHHSDSNGGTGSDSSVDDSDDSEEDGFNDDTSPLPMNERAYLEDHEASDDLEVRFEETLQFSFDLKRAATDCSLLSLLFPQVLLVAVFLDKDSSSKPSLNCNTTAGFSALMRAAEFGQLHVMEALMRRGASVNFQSTVDGSTAVMRAAGRGQFAAVRMLCERGANLKLKDKSGRTAIEWASEYRELQRYIAAYTYGSRGELTAQPGAPNPLVMCK